MARIELRNVSKRFGNTKVIDDVSLEIEDGELMVLVGPSGCGKSTLLRMIAGLEPTTQGHIRIGARDVTRLDPKDRNIAMVFQNYALYAHKNVYGNLAFGLQVRGVDAAEIDRRVSEAARMLSLEDLLQRKPRELSGGQRQRVALGRALVREPDAFLLDEPLSNLDAKLRVRMREEINALHAKIRISMVFVTHDQVEAMMLGDRIAVLKDGRVHQVGTPLQLYDNPVNSFVAGFIGSPEMNQFNGVVKAVSHVVGDGFSLDLAGAASTPLLPGQTVTIGIRPEHLVLVDPAHSALRMQVSVVEQMGAQTLIQCRNGETTIRALIERNDALRRGDEIGLNPGEGSLHLFDPKDGRTLRSADLRVN